MPRIHLAKRENRRNGTQHGSKGVPPYEQSGPILRHRNSVCLEPWWFYIPVNQRLCKN